MSGTGEHPDDQGDAARVGRALAQLVADMRANPSTESGQWGRQFDAGLAWVDFPVGLGGLGVSRSLRAVVTQTLADLGLRDSATTNGVGVSLVAPVLVSHGTAEQRQRYLRPLFTGDEVWCQLFSEPGAGSDLAGLATRATRVDDHYVIDGQKVWTTLGHVAQLGLLCARTDPTVAKHAGLSMFVLDMDSSGVEVRPIRQITGDADFNEVFMTAVEVPVDQMIGPAGSGWSSITATLANERVVFGDTPLRQGEGAIAQLSNLWSQHRTERPELTDRVLRLWVRAEAVRLAELQAIAHEDNGVPSSLWSSVKLLRSELEQDIYSLCVTLLGPAGLTYSSYEMRQPTSMADLDHGDDVRRAFLFARSATIAGGTSEIQRTIVADRVLKLPREPQVDRDTPWTQLRHG